MNDLFSQLIVVNCYLKSISFFKPWEVERAAEVADWPAYCPAVWAEVEVEVSQNNVEYLSRFIRGQKN